MPLPTLVGARRLKTGAPVWVPGAVSPPPPVIPTANINVTASFNQVDVSASEQTTKTVTVTRDNTVKACSVGYEIRGTGTNPLQASDFAGGAFPSGTINFDANGEAEATLSFIFAAKSPPSSAKTGEFRLKNAVNCHLGTASTFAISINPATQVDGAYVYDFLPPASILPSDDTKIDIWQLSATDEAQTRSEKGATDKVLLIVAPEDGSVVRNISATGLLYKAVFLIGGTFRIKGSANAKSPAGHYLLGSHNFVIGFAAGAPNPATVFLANLDIGPNTDTPCVWGDVFNINHAAANGNVNVYLQRIKHWNDVHGFSNQDLTTGVLEDGPHSDFLQCKAGSLGNVYVSRVDMKVGYQGLFFKNNDNRTDRNLRLFMKKVVFRPSAKNFQVNATTGWGTDNPVYWHTLNTLSGSDTITEVTNGNYWGIVGEDVYCLRSGTGVQDTLGQYWNPSVVPGNLRPTLASGVVTFPSYKATSQTYKVFSNFADGDFKVNWDRLPATAVVDDAEIGNGVRVATKSLLRDILNGTTEEEPTTRPELPTAKRTIRVSNYTQLKNALAGNFTGLTTVPAGATGPLKPGDHIVCEDGEYSGAQITWSTSGTAADPIVLRAKNLIGAKKHFPLFITADNTIVWGFKELDCPNTTTAVKEAPNHPRCANYAQGTNNQFIRLYSQFKVLNSERKGCVVFGPDSLNGLAAYCTCEYIGDTTINPRPTVQGQYKLSGIVVSTSGSAAKNRGKGTRITRCHIKNFPGDEAWDPPPDYNRLASGSIDVGGAYERSVNHLWYGRVDHNLLENCGGNNDLSMRQTGDRAKGGMRIEYNTVSGGYAAIRLRYCRKVDVIGNVVENARGFQVYGDDHIFNANVATGRQGGSGATTRFNFMAGDITPEFTESIPPFDPEIHEAMGCDNINLYGCQGPAVVGEWERDKQEAPSVPATNIRFYKHKNASGAFVTGTFPVAPLSVGDLVTNSTITVSNTLPAGVTLATPRKMTAAEVGYKAPWVIDP